MYFSKRKNKDGTVTFRFTSVDRETNKRVPLPQDKVPHFDSEDEARAWAKSQGAEESARVARIEKRLQWRTQNHNLVQLLATYSKWPNRAPNSWKSNVSDSPRPSRSILQFP